MPGATGPWKYPREFSVSRPVPGGSLPLGPLRRLSLRARSASAGQPVAHCVQHPGDRRRCAALAGRAAGALRPGPASLLRAISILHPSPRLFPLTGGDMHYPRGEQNGELLPVPSPCPIRLACATKLEKRFPLRAPRSRPNLEASLTSLLRQSPSGLPSAAAPCPPGSARDAVLVAPMKCAPRCEARWDTRGLGSRGPPRALDIQMREPWSYSRAAGMGWRMRAHSKSRFVKIITW